MIHTLLLVVIHTLLLVVIHTLLLVVIHTLLLVVIHTLLLVVIHTLLLVVIHTLLFLFSFKASTILSRTSTTCRPKSSLPPLLPKAKPHRHGKMASIGLRYPTHVLCCCCWWLFAFIQLFDLICLMSPYSEQA